ncbi:MAG: TenA family transcriptional regulator [Pirellulales bacterium]|nr:TenA family transcriptional regulator [Pirellulales bacterium]
MILRDIQESSLVVGAGKLWHEATEAEFLSAIRDGKLPRDAFQRWLVQDYSFAKGITTFQAIAVARTPRPAQTVLIQGLSALDAELDWFEQNAKQHALELNTALHPTCSRYVDYLVASAYTQPFEVLLAILYGVEASYLCAWSALEASGPYAEFINRWSNVQFVTYVRELLDVCNRHTHDLQQEQFNEVLRHERDFWRMTWEG